MLGIVIAFLILFGTLQSRAAPLCPTIQIMGAPSGLNFSSEEKRLLCGDNPGSGGPWSTIPPRQARIQMKAILQSQGYDNPHFKSAGGILYVEPGKPTLITAITVSGAPPQLAIRYKRDVIGERLTPAKLDDINSWIDRRLRFTGYPCPQEAATADARTGQVFVTVEPGPRQKIASIDVNDNLGLVEGTLRRYDAFQIGSYFDSMDLILTERRVVADNVVASTHFSSDCTPQGAAIHQYVEGGPPRVLTFGFGFNTEQLFLVRSDWRHSRLDNRASMMEADLQAGFLTQQITTDAKLFYSGDSRDYLKPSLTFFRDKEQYYETENFTAGLKAGKSWDETRHGWMAEIGPDWQLSKTVVGIGPADFHSVALDGHIQIISHDYEYYQTDPRQGFRAAVDTSFSQQAVGSSQTLQRFTTTGEDLWNVGRFSPPLVVQGIRWGLGTTVTPLDVTDPNIPALMRNFLGGENDLRGFSRQELPTSGFGALSFAFACIETRYNGLLPFHLQPSFFVDGGELGVTPFALGWPLYWDPGVGLRWASPIGVFRATLAHGFAFSPSGVNPPAPEHWQGYLSFGEEF